MNVRLHFTGLCAFIPKRAIDQPNNEVTVALVDATGSHHGPHYCICFAQPLTYPEELGPGVPNRTVDLAFTFVDSPITSLRVNGCRLDREELKLVGRTAGGQEVPLADNSLSFDSGARGPCPTNPTQFFCEWVASMASVGAGTVRPEVLNGGGGLLGARLRLTAGRIRTNAFRTTAPQGIVRWAFGGADSALAEEVAWDFTFADPNVVEVVLKTSPLAGAQRQPVVLRPQAGLVEAWIVDMPLGSLLGFDPIRPLEPDHHFEEFFRLALNPPAAVIPTPNGTFCIPPSGPSNPKCPPAFFSA